MCRLSIRIFDGITYHTILGGIYYHNKLYIQNAMNGHFNLDYSGTKLEL